MFCYCYQFSFPNSLHEYTPRELFPANELYLFSHEKYSMLFTATFSHGFFLHVQMQILNSILRFKDLNSFKISFDCA